MSDPIPADDEPAIGDITQTVLVTCIVVGIITLVGVVGNGLMLRAYIKYDKLRTNFYTVFCGLSIADTFFLLISAPTYIKSATTSDPYFKSMVTSTEKTWCKLNFYLMDACNFTSAYLLVVLTVLRAILLTSRNVRRQPKPFHLVTLSCAIYVIAFTSSIPILNNFNHGCRFDVAEEESNLIDEWLKSLFSLFFPLSLMLIVHFVAHKLSKRYFSESYSPREREKSRLVITIVGAFTICQLPYRITCLYIKYTLDQNDFDFDFDRAVRYQTVKDYMMCLWFLDKAIRPILYSKLASDLCKAFDEVINCTYCSRAYLREPLYDQPERTQVITVGVEQNNGHVTNSAQDIEVPETGNQTVLVENVEVYSCEGYNNLPDEGYGESNSSTSGGSAEEAKCKQHDKNGHSLNRLVSTSSSTSATSATSQTPLVSRGKAVELEDDAV